MIRQIAVITGVFLICMGSASAKNLTCAYFLTPIYQQGDFLPSTQRLVAYLGVLWNQKIINEDVLNKLAEEIQAKAKLSNPIPHNKAGQGIHFTNSSYQIHYENLEYYLAQPDLDFQEISNWLNNVLSQHQQVQKEKEKAKTTTQIARVEMKLHKVSSGQFVMGEAEKKVEVQLTHNFLAMATPVTQWMWVSEMKINPSHFKNGPNRIEISLDNEIPLYNRIIELQPDNPIENVTWYSAAWFANLLSKKYGFKEVYDFSEVEFKPGTFAHLGTLSVSKGTVKINGLNIYETEGFRLPTEAEQEYLMTNKGDPQVTAESLIPYAWYADNSNNRTHPVMEKDAFVIDDQDFYDLHGNVHEWSHDSASMGNRSLKGGKNPHEEQGDCHAVRGGSHFDKSEFLNPRGLACNFSNLWSNTTGFRLVRTAR